MIRKDHDKIVKNIFEDFECFIGATYMSRHDFEKIQGKWYFPKKCRK